MSETVYPVVLELRRKDVEEIQAPIAVYCACPEEAYLAKQDDAKRLISHGIGLITIDKEGRPQLRASCIPLAQQISQTLFKAELTVPAFSTVMKRRLAETFERYRQSAPAGVADLSEVLEGMVLRAGQDAARKAWIKANQVKAGFPAQTIDAMLAERQCQSATAALGGMRSYISQYRNIAHHFPKNKRQAHIKYQDCKHAFIEGMKVARHFRDAVKGIGLSGQLPKL